MNNITGTKIIDLCRKKEYTILSIYQENDLAIFESNLVYFVIYDADGNISKITYIDLERRYIIVTPNVEKLLKKMVK